MSAAPIAIVGLGGVFPDGPDPATFAANTLAGKSAARELPADRWIIPPDAACTPEFAADRTYSRRACLIDDFSANLDGLAVDPALVAALDPLYALTLAAGRQAFESAVTAPLDRARVGVALAAIALPTDASSAITRGLLGGDFARRLFASSGVPPSTFAGDFPQDVHPLNAQVTGLPARLLAAALGLGGGCFTLDAACASSLYALKLACADLRRGRLDAVLAGGVSRPECLYTQMGFSQLRALSPSGVCRPFDAAADGLVVGEGAGIVVLKRLDDALAHGDRIHAVIRGMGWSNDIAGSLLAADSAGQLRAMRQAYREAGWQPADVDLIECHGTGTPLGDAVEFASLRALWEDTNAPPGVCTLASVKASIGHLLTGAAAAGLIRTLLAMEAGQLPPTAGFRSAARGLDIENSPFRVLTEATEWPLRTENTPRRAAVSAFGFGGINAHLLLESHQPAQTRAHAVRTAPRDESTPCAIVGMGLHVGQVDSVERFAEVLFGGESAIGPRPVERWRGLEEHPRLAELRDLPGGYISALAVPIGKYKLPPNEIPETLPQQLLALEVVDQALADAGLPRRADRSRMGVIAGIALDLNTSNFHHRWVIRDRVRMWAERLGIGPGDEERTAWIAALEDEAGPPLNAGRVLGALGGIVASRIAREFGFGGPSFGVSCGAASGLRALDIATQALARGELDTAVVAAVDLAGDPRAVAAVDAAGEIAFTRDGRVRPLDQAFTGTAPADGAVALILRRAEDAAEAKHSVHALIEGLGFANGANEGDALSVAAERAQAGLAEDSPGPGLIVTDGSGTRDSQSELSQLHAAADRSPAGCALACAAAHVGHAGAAAGLISLAAAALSLRRSMLPVHPDFAALPGELPNRSRLFVPQGPQPFVRDRALGPRRAEVYVSERDGEAACVCLREAESGAAVDCAVEVAPAATRRAAVFAVGGATVAELRRRLADLAAFADEQEAAPLIMGHRWQARHPLPGKAERAVAIVAGDRDALRTACTHARAHLAGAPQAPLNGEHGIHYAPEPMAERGALALVFPGSGNHFVGMGRQIAADFPDVLARLDAETETLASQMQAKMFFARRTEYTPGWEKRIEREIAEHPLISILGQVSYGVLMSDVLTELGVRPQAAIGYSLGETTSLFALRAWRDRDEMYRRMTASPLFQRDLAGPCEAARRTWRLADDQPVDWRVVLVNRPAEEVRQAVLRSPHAYLLITNAPDECVIGGRGGDVEDVLITLGAEAVDLLGTSTVHCGTVRAVADAYRALHDLPVTAPEGVQFYSAAGGAAHVLTRASAAESILQQALTGFDFNRLIMQAHADGVRTFVEVGPLGSCTRMIGKILKGRPHFAVTASRRDERAALAELVAALVAQRVISDLTPYYRHVRDEKLGEADAERTIEVPVGGPPPQPMLPPSFNPDSTRSQPPEPEPATGGLASTAHPIAAPSDRETPADAVGAERGLAAQVARSGQAVAEAHDTFLRFSQRGAEALSAGLAAQAQAITALADAGVRVTQPPVDAAAVQPAQPVVFDRAMCMEFATGSVAKVLGPLFAEVDTYRVRVRLPDEPLMLVDRILSVEGEKNALTRGRIVTEHDVRAGDWYLDGGVMPTSITVESGQADLFLCAYLGIDLRVRGARAYRLLDATVAFHRGLPVPGETVRYDIRIDRFVRQGDTYLFFFEFDATIAGRPVLTMRNGCAGFFTDEEIRASGGIIETNEEKAPPKRTGDANWPAWAPPADGERYAEARIDALRRGDLAGAFGEAFANLPLADPVRIPDGRMRLVHRVVHLDSGGGRYGLGVIRAEADIHPDDWFLTCHFVDDMVMPGTLMYECCAHTLRILLMRMGWLAEHAATRYEPVLEVPSALRCRGPVTRATRVVTYEVHVKAIGFGPEPYVLADALMSADGEMIVRFTDMSLKMSGLNRDDLARVWANRAEAGGPAVSSGAIAPIGEIPIPSEAKPAVYGSERIRAFAVGNPSEAFGERYRVFDRKRRIARLPGPPYQVLDRITEVRAPAWELSTEGWIEGQYDVPPDAWYFGANRQRAMPFAVLLEIALQPCGWLAAYKGSALTSATDLSFRNLGGTATLHEELFADAGTLTTRVRMTQVSRAGGMIIEDFDMQVWRAGGCVYAGTTSFGFFSGEALAQQVGVRDASARRYVPTPAEMASAQAMRLPGDPPRTPDDPRSVSADGLALPGRALCMLDEITGYLPTGGPHGLGFIRGRKQVDPGEWFFAAHFYQDPVCPGSLGLESFLQLLKVVARERWGAQRASTHRFTSIEPRRPHTWAYRGQIIPTNRQIEVEAVITAIEDDPVPTIRANGFLIVDGVVIYEMTDFGITLVAV
jgi:acyl transferase domain-containing protein/3-hydroxymyristoyl/3-hydroxydecanoyl-(acyl carrier protein) dehydratase